MNFQLYVCYYVLQVQSGLGLGLGIGFELDKGLGLGLGFNAPISSTNNDLIDMDLKNPV